MSQMTPREIVSELDKHIIGQASAKRSVAIALRNRWRRSQVSAELRDEITPKNILMIGPTGVGKTEIARRLARLANAPFIKIEATKFTEVGLCRPRRGIHYPRFGRYGRQNVANVRNGKSPDPRRRRRRRKNSGYTVAHLRRAACCRNTESNTRQKMRKKLREGDLNDKEIRLMCRHPSVGVEIMAPPGMEEMTSQLQGMFQNLNSGRTKSRKLKIKDALKLLQEEEAGKLVNEEEIKQSALEAVEQHGIVFLDEIDKICKRSELGGGEVSREGVQRDLLPLVEGSTVSTKYGMIKTDHILFIASGAFHLDQTFGFDSRNCKAGFRSALN